MNGRLFRILLVKHNCSKFLYRLYCYKVYDISLIEESPPVPGGVNLSGRNAAHHPLMQQPARERTGPHFKCVVNAQ